MKPYISPEESKTFKEKPIEIQELINTALYILDCFGIPLEATPRRLERTAIAFLASSNIKKIADIKNAKDLNSGYSLKTREIITFVNEHFNETISPGSYDDIRRKDLKLLTIAEVVLQSSPNSATNDSTRGYSLNPTYGELVRSFGSPNWEQTVAERLKDIEPLSQKLKRERTISKVDVTLPSGGHLSCSIGEHNDLQKAIIEEFLPRYGHGAEVLYVGDTSDKYLYLEKEKLEQLRFFEISHEELPDVIAYSKKKNWLYLIEAVHSSGPINEIRLLQLQKLTKDCTADIVYITAFLNRQKFRQFMTEIAWETEVWTADNPDHLVHFNGDKFLGPYSK
ncbi:BsuBI/PstI family type II restriction endonuclease [Runella slithyformis]|uniref:Type II site-specific deoxyribonuclease n=1 Tax=Runella slithyformis (strain ATCC 29530 / DSM 19594 / LMG 11500 / NCIMB 11436 / LSU 4) TaxID=761193 RepID=A0A7U4E875_RUNSL|nr:BsuBI/PstI family type II restriction endonuclease [Runella slithyformis]AEI51401.1 Type II site-specific deoxyribonuclease [Runella slithyformis DSM 19594]